MATKLWQERLLPRLARIWAVVRVQWYLGFTSFGGPPVHFKIYHDKFVRTTQWIDEQMFQELFSISQTLSGPASTKMLYSINLIQAGTVGAIVSFLIWSAPGALGMYGLGIGVSRVGEQLPRLVYAVLSGLNAATVGVIALAAVELSQKSATDKLTRFIIFFTASAGMLYNALWYFPVLMTASGCATLVYDKRWLHRTFAAGSKATMNALRGIRGVHARSVDAELTAGHPTLPTTGRPTEQSSTEATADESLSAPTNVQQAHAQRSEDEEHVVPANLRLPVSWQVGVAVLGGLLVAIVTIMVLRSTLVEPPLLFRLFANMVLAGTIIFGGGPVVIPLLREYVVQEGWVSPRDFLIGVALIQAFPGPNFNIAVFLGALAAINGGKNSWLGAMVAWVGIFAPGLVLAHGIMGIWAALRSRPSVRSALRGINAGAVGLIYTAVYRIWQVGYIDAGFETGSSLGNDPWWVVVAATSYVGGRWFGVSPWLAIITGAVLGLVRLGVVSAQQ